MKKYLMISLVFLLSGCAYFNIFYNAEHYYNQAVKPLESGSQVRVDLLEKSIEKSSKILEFHSESKYVDDALILIGKSYMYLADYTKAIRKFNELITYYSESPYYDEAVYYLGNTYRLQGESEIARGYLQRLFSSEGGFRLKAYIAAVDILTEKEDYVSADSLINTLSDADRRRQSIMYKQAEIKFHMKKYEEAVSILEAINPGKLENLERFNYYIIYMRSLTGSGRPDKAISTAQKSMKYFTEEKMKNSINLRKAEILVSQGKFTDAASLIEDILVQSQKVAIRDSLLFYQGQIYETQLEQYEKARGIYKKILSEERRSLLIPEAEVKVRTLDLLLDISADSSADEEQAVKNRFLLAEINYLSLGRYEEAMKHYAFIADSFPDDVNAPKSIYAIAYIRLNEFRDSSAAESLLSIITDKYKGSEFYIDAETLLERIRNEKPHTD